MNLTFLSVLYRFSPVSFFRVHGTSMLPTYHHGDIVLASPLPFLLKGLRKGDVVVCVHPRNRKVLIKRIGVITNNNFFIHGDNVLKSTDSRTFGLIPRKHILAKVIYSL